MMGLSEHFRQSFLHEGSIVMKWNGKTRMFQGLRPFAVPAGLCLVLCILASWQGFIPYSSEKYSLYRTLHEPLNALIACTSLGLVLSTAACCIPWRKAAHGHIAAALSAAVMMAVHWFWPLPDLACMGLALACVALCVHLASRGDQPLQLNRIAGWFLVCLGVSCVLCAAMQGIAAAVMGLFLQDLPYGVSYGVTNALLFVSFLWVAPWLFLGGVMDCRGSRFRWFSSRVLLPLYLILVAVLLAYVGKIVITREMPVGVMNAYALTALALYVFFHLTLTGGETKLSALFFKWGAWAMLPILAAQAVGVYIRVEAYGFTSARIWGVVMTLLCVGAVVSGLLRKRARWFLPVLAAVLLVLPMAAHSLAIADQAHRLEAALVRNGMVAADGSILPNENADAEDRQVLYSSMDYLLDAGAPEDCIIHRMKAQMEEALIAKGTWTREQLDATAYWYSSADKEGLLGFEKPRLAKAETTYHSWTFDGTADRYRLDASGWDYAEFVTLNQFAYTDEEPVPDAGKNRFSSFPADVLDALMASAGEPFRFPDVPVLIELDGQALDIRPYLTDVTADPDGDGRDFLLADDHWELPNGKVLHVCHVYFGHSDHPAYGSSSMTLDGWLLTPEAE